MAAGSYDYVIVGAGSAGCVLAHRLTEDPGVKVLVIEAGGEDRDPFIHIPLGLGRLWEKRLHDWGYDTEPEPSLDNREIEMMRGKVLGGSSSINAMSHIRGHPADYDRWAARPGLENWSYRLALPYFKRSEAWRDGSSPHRGASGPIAVRFTNRRDPLSQAIIEAGQAAGYPASEDINGASVEGFGFSQSAIARGRRCSAAVGYLRPALRRPNLALVTQALATRVLIEGGRAIGLEFLRRGRIERAMASREVLLAGGSINSPQLLMLSGIGDADALRAHGIAPVSHLPGVGANFQDHLCVNVSHLRLGRSPLQHTLRADRIALAMLQSWLGREGPAAELPGGVTAMLKTRPGLEAPDIQLLFRGAAINARPWLGREPGWTDGFTLRPVLIHPQSRGTVSLASSDPSRRVRICANFLSAGADLETLLRGIRVTRQVCNQAPLESFRGPEVLPGPGRTTDADLIAFVRATAVTAHHPSGTCRMGTDELAVVDAELRVRGVAQLRVVDASVMPDLVSSNIHACVLMIAERAADLVKGLARLREDSAAVADVSPMGADRTTASPRGSMVT